MNPVNKLVNATVRLEQTLPDYSRENHTELIRIIDALIKVMDDNLDSLKMFESDAEKLGNMFLKNIHTKVAEPNGMKSVRNTVRAQEALYDKLYKRFDEIQGITDEVEGLHETLKGLAGIYAKKVKAHLVNNSGKANIKSSFDKLRVLHQKVKYVKREISSHDSLLSRLDEEHSDQQYLLRSAERRATTRSNNRAAPLLGNRPATSTRKNGKAKKCGNMGCAVMG